MRDAFRSVDPSINDENFLAVFKAAGCYLTDLCPEPVDHLNSKLREAARQAGEQLLTRKIVQLQPETIAPVLRSIAQNVANAASNGNWHGPIVHLPYPGRWYRHKNIFIETLAPLLRKLMSSPGAIPD